MVAFVSFNLFHSILSIEHRFFPKKCILIYIRMHFFEKKRFYRHVRGSRVPDKMVSTLRRLFFVIFIKHKGL